MTDSPSPMHCVATPNAPSPRGHYAQAVVANGMVYVAGLLPGEPHGGQIAQGDAQAQVRQVLRNLDAVLQAAGSARGKVVSLQVFLCDSAIWGVMNTACTEFFGAHKPARTAVPILPLRDGAMLEINAIALS